MNILGVQQIRDRFGLGPREARVLIRKMRHLQEGAKLWTTEAWLAEWAAANSLPGRAWPDPERDREPVDADVVQRAIELVGAMADRGVVKICAVP